MEHVKYTFITLLLVFLVGCGNEDTSNDDAQSEAKDTEEMSESKEEATSSSNASEDANEEESEEQADASSTAKQAYYVDPASYRILPLEDDASRVALLTIDDAPDQHALEMAETLKKHDAPAIFFVNGMYLNTEEGKDTLQKIYDMGFEIGNHTMTHANLSNLDPQATVDEIIPVNDMVEEITGERPRFFRAPFGVNTDASIQVTEDEDMTLMNWTYGYDWEAEYQDADALADIMVNTELLDDGANLLMHDRTWTKDALSEIVSGLRAKEYELIDPANIQSAREEDADEE
ncbi:polysaccharide deacetylase family protein [Salinicoccus sp. CNSTN-B1]